MAARLELPEPALFHRQQYLRAAEAIRRWLRDPGSRPPSEQAEDLLRRLGEHLTAQVRKRGPLLDVVKAMGGVESLTAHLAEIEAGARAVVEKGKSADNAAVLQALRDVLAGHPPPDIPAMVAVHVKALGSQAAALVQELSRQHSLSPAALAQVLAQTAAELDPDAPEGLSAVYAQLAEQGARAAARKEESWAQGVLKWGRSLAANSVGLDTREIRRLQVSHQIWAQLAAHLRPLQAALLDLAAAAQAHEAAIDALAADLQALAVGAGTEPPPRPPAFRLGGARLYDRLEGEGRLPEVSTVLRNYHSLTPAELRAQVEQRLTRAGGPGELMRLADVHPLVDWAANLKDVVAAAAEHLPVPPAWLAVAPPGLVGLAGLRQILPDVAVSQSHYVRADELYLLAVAPLAVPSRAAPAVEPDGSRRPAARRGRPPAATAAETAVAVAAPAGPAAHQSPGPVPLVDTAGALALVLGPGIVAPAGPAGPLRPAQMAALAQWWQHQAPRPPAAVQAGLRRLEEQSARLVPPAQREAFAELVGAMVRVIAGPADDFTVPHPSGNGRCLRQGD